MAQRPRVILVDGQALLYRAYYAIPATFSTAAGLPTNATYGFATMFRKMLAGRRPEYGAVVFDAPGPTFRDGKYPDYKAQRPSMPEDLRPQLEWVDRLVEAYRFPLFRVSGFEADDVIGTLTRQATEADMEIFIVSGDKDFAQLIGEHVRMIDTLRDVTYDPELVRKKWGVPPSQFVDLLALMGDKIDNIPGVPGIGAKGAAGLLEKYGSLDGILAHTEELKGRQKKTLEENRDLAELSRDLATIELNVPLDVGLENLRLDLPEPASLNDLYRELEFFSLLTEDAEAVAEQAEDADDAAISSLEELDNFIAALPTDTPVAIVPIFDGHSPLYGRLVGLTFATGPEGARYVPIRCEATGESALGDGAIERLRAYFADAEHLKIAYNAKHLWMALRRLGITLRGVEGDLLLESFLVDPVKLIPHELGQIVKEYLQRTLPPAKNLQGSGKKRQLFLNLPIAEVMPWACQRARAVAEAWPKLRERLVDEGRLDVLNDVELPLAWILGAMEIDGIGVDPDDLHSLGEDFSARLQEIESEIFSLAGREFNVGSPKQLSAVLFEELELPVIKRTKTGYSTNAEVLQRLAPKHEIAGHILEHRKLAKLINTYTDVLQAAVHPISGRIHATFQQTVGATGRLITTDPDLQRTPVKTPEGKRIRRCFVARPGSRLIAADWSQIELRLLAHFTADELLVEAFAKDLDVHARTAAQLFDVNVEDVQPEQRGVGKLVNFSTIYGQGATALGQILGVPRKEAQRYIDGYFEAYHGVREWRDRTVEAAHEDGWVETILGRRRYIPELRSNSFMDRQTGERMAANTPIQGSAADLCKLAMLAIARRFEEKRLHTRMLLQVHDELVFEAPENEVETVVELVRQEMEDVHPLAVPLRADVGVGNNWAEAK